jgi:hypothetical protein
MLIEHIDAIARKKQRTVLHVIFHARLSEPFDWEASSARRQIIAWLDAQGIDWMPCGHVANDAFLCSYRGQIYIDVPFDESHPDYRRVRDYLEHPDGTMAIDGAKFCYYPLSEAMKNAHHDAPGYWDA